MKKLFSLFSILIASVAYAEPPEMRLPETAPPSVVQNFSKAADSIDVCAKLINAPAAWELTKGEGVTLFVFDDGFQPSHPEFKGLDITLEDFTGEGTNNPGPHGNHVLSRAVGQKLIDGIAPRIKKVYGFKVLKKSGSGNFSMLTKALDRATFRIKRDNLKAVGTASIGTEPTATAPKDFDPNLEKAIRSFMDTGSPFCAAMGNAGPRSNTAGFPARYAEIMKVFAVCSCNAERNISNFSSRGDAAVVTSQGESIVGAVLNGEYAEWDGTSMATPQIAAALCLWMALHADTYTGLDRVSAAWEALQQACSKPETRDPNRGYGLLDCGKLVNYKLKPQPPVTPPAGKPGMVTITFADLSAAKQAELRAAGVDVFNLTFGHSVLESKTVPVLVPVNNAKPPAGVASPGANYKWTYLGTNVGGSHGGWGWQEATSIGPDAVPANKPVPAAMPPAAMPPAACPPGGCQPAPVQSTRSIPLFPRLWR